VKGTRREKKSQKPFVPHERCETIRHNIISVLRGHTLTAKDISREVMISEREVYDHLEHIQKTMNKKKQSLILIPASCRKCGFEFRKRDRLKKPGKCPVCRSSFITDPLFSFENE
jgi:hypothetical protein